MTRLLSAFSMLVLVAAAMTASGCIKRMKMPSEELVWQPAPDRFERGAERFEEVGRLEEVNGKKDFSVYEVIASDDGDVVAFAATIRGYVGPREPGNWIVVSGVVVWSIVDGTREWVSVPRQPDSAHEEKIVPLAFSADLDLLAVTSAGRDLVWSRREKRIVFGTEEEASYGYGAGEFEELFERARVNRPILLASGHVPWTYEGADGYVVPFHYEPVESADGHYLAASYASRGYFLGTGDNTPGHMRVWDTDTEKLVSWSGATEELHRWDCSRPFVFLEQPDELLYADREGVHIVNVEMRRIIATVPHEDEYMSVNEMHWLPKAGLLAVEYRESFKLLRVRE